MKRRDFITFIGGAVAWPVAALTQPAGKVYRVGWLFYIWKVTDAPAQPLFRAFVHGLRDAGYVEGQNLVLELLSAEGKYERIGELAMELVSRNPDVILAGGGNLMARALQRVTKSVPIVIPFSYDPVGRGSWKASHAQVAISQASPVIQAPRMKPKSYKCLRKPFPRRRA